MRKIQYQNKVAIDPDIQLPAINKVTDSDMNEIKSVVNANADDLETLETTTTGYVSNTDTRMNALELSMTNLENDVDTFEETINGDISDIESSISDITSTTYTKTEVDTLLNAKATTTSLNNEISARENADTSLQNQIDAIVASSDVVDIVGTYTDLQNYDTSKLGDNDIIKVLDDSTHSNATSYYRWHNSTWNYIGSEGPYYTKGETDTLLNGKVDKEAGKGLSQNDFTNTLKSKLDNIESNAQVNKIESIKVNNVTQTITSKSVNISVPTKTSDLINDSDYYTKPSGGIPSTDMTSAVQTSLGKADTAVQNTDYANGTTAGVFKTSSGYGTEVSTSGFLRGVAKTYSDYGNADTATIISKGTLDNVLTAVVGDINTLLDTINGEVI